MARQRTFTTAAARRRLDPIIWTIDDTEIKLRASVDITSLADLVDGLTAEPAPGTSDIKAAHDKRQTFLALVKSFVEDESLEAFDKIEPDLDPTILTDMVTELLTEYGGGADPTEASSSPGGSSTTGSSSTGGAVPEDSTH